MSAISIATGIQRGNAGVTAITNKAGIYPIDLPQGVGLPCTVTNVVSGLDEPMLEGAAKYYLNRVTINCLAATSEQAETLRNAVMAALEDNKNLTLGRFKDISTRFANFERTDKSDGRGTYRWTLDFYIRWRAA